MLPRCIINTYLTLITTATDIYLTNMIDLIARTFIYQRNMWILILTRPTQNTRSHTYIFVLVLFSPYG